ncbi:MAG: hypothetical protein R3E98_09530 [Gemmatimonadota bacterium]|nr:hypothetical protein [Gemmatimonadota bacterium]
MRETLSVRPHPPLRSAVCALAALALATLPAPLRAQTEAAYRTDLPDAHAPAGQSGDHLLPRGSFQIGYRFSNTSFDELREGSTDLTGEDVLNLYPVAPVTRTVLEHELELMYGITDGVTLQVLLPYRDLETGHLTSTTPAFFTRASGLGDVEVRALVRLFGEGATRAHLDLGLAVPTGAIDAVGATPLAPAGTVLPYGMQPGSGSFAARPGATVFVQNEQGSVGAQLRGTLHLNDNDRGYRRGDRIGVAAWLAPRINDYLSVSIGLQYENFDRLSGIDRDLDPAVEPGNDPAFYGGERVEIPFGLNFFMAQGPFAGHRLSAEVSFAPHQDYDGIQLDRSRRFSVRWRKAF